MNKTLSTKKCLGSPSYWTDVFIDYYRLCKRMYQWPNSLSLSFMYAGMFTVCFPEILGR